MKPNFDIEKSYWDKGYFVIGVDEVGRGAVAGPVVAASAATKFEFLKRIEGLRIDDSKRLTRKKREELEPIIKKYFYFGIGEASVYEINKFGIVRATRRAMKRAIRKLPVSKVQLPIKFLIDGRRVKGIGHQKAIIKGDQKSISIAAASIIAKVYRDKLMRKLGKIYSGYGFEHHVGYGTRKHAEMIIKHGLCKIHRIEFARSLVKVR